MQKKRVIKSNQNQKATNNNNKKIQAVTMVNELLCNTWQTIVNKKTIDESNKQQGIATVNKENIKQQQTK